MSVSISKEQFAELLVSGLCTAETSVDPHLWFLENPLWGHCAVVALVAQNLFGGVILRAPLDEITGFRAMRSHYWNRFDDGDVDFSASQFDGELSIDRLVGVPRARHELLAHEPTLNRYKQLAYTLASMIEPSPIFDDAIHKMAFFAALDSPCQKMKFGVVVMREAIFGGENEPVHVSCNATIGPLASMCQPTCIRLGIQSRTESMVGACGHAEEHALAWLQQEELLPADHSLYIVGLQGNCLPWFRAVRAHTCLRCAVQMYNAKLGMIHVALKSGWGEVTTEEALLSAKDFALGTTKV